MSQGVAHYDAVCESPWVESQINVKGVVGSEFRLGVSGVVGGVVSVRSAWLPDANKGVCSVAEAAADAECRGLAFRTHRASLFSSNMVSASPIITLFRSDRVGNTMRI